MSGVDIYNWDDGSVAVGRSEIRVTSSSRKRGFMSVGLDSVVSSEEVSTVRDAFAERVTAMNPDSTYPVETTVETILRIDGFSARREDGTRLATKAFEELPADASEKQIAAAKRRLAKLVAAQLETAVERAAFRSRADA